MQKNSTAMSFRLKGLRLTNKEKRHSHSLDYRLTFLLVETSLSLFSCVIVQQKLNMAKYLFDGNDGPDQPKSICSSV